MSTPRTYLRPMNNWWRRLPFYRRYMLRETTCIAVLAYALVLLTGLWRFTQGQAAFEAWRAALASPLAIVMHLVVFAGMVFHSWTWFEVMPKTMPFVRVGGKRIGDSTIVGSGVAVAVVVTIVVIALTWWGLK